MKNVTNRKNITIIVKIDRESNMAWVTDNNGNTLEGNFWDFHNGCHGNWDLPEFKNLEEYIQVLKNLNINKGYNVIINRKAYEYYSRF